MNIGPDEPFGGGVPGEDFPVADPLTTGQIMQFRVRPSRTVDLSTPAHQLVLPAITPLGPADRIRKVGAFEEESETVFVPADENGEYELDGQGRLVFDPNGSAAFAPKEAVLGTVRIENVDGEVQVIEEHRSWDDEVSEQPLLGSTELWEIHNFTEDAHPIHVHLVQFEVVEREDENGFVRQPEAWENGLKDTVIAYPKEITRIKAKFDVPGRFVWHCHIVEHEDNEMMRPYDVVRPEIEDEDDD